MYSENVAFCSYTSVLVINYKNTSLQFFNTPVDTAVLEHYMKGPL